MAQTKLGAAKVAANYYGMTLDEYVDKLKTQKACKVCKQWKPREMFCRDAGRDDGLGKACYKCRRVKVRVCTKGRTSAFKGKEHTEEAKAKMRVIRKGQTNAHRIGAKHSPETKKRISDKHKALARRGPANPNWKGGSPHLSELEKLRRSAEYKEWRKAVYERDKYICQMCGDAKGGNLHAHHLKSFAQYVDLRFDVDNGLTLCEDCHCVAHRRYIRKGKQNG